MQSESKYDHNNDMKSNSPTISTISNNEQFGSNNAIYKSQAVRQRHKSAAKKPAKKRTKDDDVGICEDILQLLRSKFYGFFFEKIYLECKLKILIFRILEYKTN